MKEEKIWAAGVWIFAVLWTIGIGWVADSWIVMIWALLGFIIASVAVLWIRANERKKHKLKEKLWREESLELIRRMRHDWLNELQLIYGYIRLNKYDKLPPFVESLKHNLQNESMLASLKSSLVEWELLSFRTKGNGLKVQVHVDPSWEPDKWLMDDRSLALMLRDWLEAIRREKDAHLSVEVHIQFVRQEEDAVIMLNHTGFSESMDVKEMVRHLVREWPKITAKQHIDSEGFCLELTQRKG